MGKHLSTILVLLSLFLFFAMPQNISAQEEPVIGVQDEKLEARIENVLEEKMIQMMDPSTALGTGKEQLYQKLELYVISGKLKDQTITVENGNLLMTNILKFKRGDEVVISRSQGPDGNDFFYITDFVRRGALWWLFVIFAGLTVAIGRWRGVTSLIGMGISFAVIFVFILPQILAGRDPILISILGSLVIIPVIFYLSHGINRKTTVAVLGTLIALVITGILANIFVEVSKLSGFASEEASFLQIAKQGAVNIKGLLLAGIIIGVLGVLDDVTVAQAAVVYQLKKANKELRSGELYKRAMDVGRDHIASVVNTLFLVYAGAALPLLLLFINNPQPFSEVVNYEIIANEIIRTLVGSIGLILAVPITSYIAAIASKES